MSDVRIPIKKLNNFAVRSLMSVGAQEADAQTVSDVLVEADMREIFSHGTARLSRYIQAVKNGEINISAVPEFISERGATAVLSAHDSFGQVAGIIAINKAKELAKNSGIGMVTVRNSSHFGIAGYYAERVLPDMIGIAMTNTSPLVVPTNGNQAVLGTNPIAIAVPTNTDPWLMDLSTSIISRGKIEVYEREGKPLETGWAVDGDGYSCTDPSKMLNILKNRLNGGICPMADYKGYGLSAMVDILSGLISGAGFGLDVGGKDHADIGHCFIVINIDHFIDKKEFLIRMDNFCKQLQNSSAPGKRVFLHGEKENIARHTSIKSGVILKSETDLSLKLLANDLKIDYFY